MSAPTRKVLLLRPRGYCAGVERAVQAVEVALEQFGAPVYVRKQIVHYTHVVANLEKRGAIFVEETEEVPEGSVVVFSAHGIAPQVRDDAKSRGLRTIDATCPLVTKVHSEARRFAAQGYDILLIGHDGHEEVIGTTGEAPASIHLVDGPEGSDSVQVRDPSKVAWLSQTTLSVDETKETVSALRERFPQLLDPPSDDICYATQNRQTAVKQIAADCDVLIVVGSANSSNSVRLVEVALDSGAKAAHLVDDASAIDPEWLTGASTVGVSSGASVPEVLVDGLLSRLSELGFSDVEEIEAVKERMVFALPRELRQAAPAGDS
ncbi:MAG TPA: 4-hydroxy-3-methylbut-2-enyl diphosphate reductase [Streptosporangiaceae bacterium]